MAPSTLFIAVNSTLETTPMALIHACQERYPEAKILLLADPAADLHLAACLAAGAAGVFPLDLEAAALLRAVRAVLTYGLVGSIGVFLLSSDGILSAIPSGVTTSRSGRVQTRPLLSGSA